MFANGWQEKTIEGGTGRKTIELDQMIQPGQSLLAIWVTVTRLRARADITA
jgi:hypothetical protein